MLGSVFCTGENWTSLLQTSCIKNKPAVAGAKCFPEEEVYFSPVLIPTLSPGV